MAVVVTTSTGRRDITSYVTINIPESATDTDFLGQLASRRNYEVFDPFNELNPFYAGAYFNTSKWRLATIEETNENGELIYRGQIEDIQQADDGKGPILTIITQDPIGILLQFPVTFFDSTTCDDWTADATAAGSTTLAVTGGTTPIPKGAVISFNSNYAPNYLVTDNTSNTLTLDRELEFSSSGALFVMLPRLTTGAAALKSVLEALGYASILDDSFDNLDSIDTQFNRFIYLFIRPENNFSAGQFIALIKELARLELVINSGNIGIKRGFSRSLNTITRAELLPPFTGPSYDSSRLVIGYDLLYAVPSETVDGVPTWGEVQKLEGDIDSVTLAQWTGKNFWQPFSNGSTQIKDHIYLYNSLNTAQFFGNNYLDQYGKPRIIISGGLKRNRSGNIDSVYRLSLFQNYDVVLDNNYKGVVKSYSFKENEHKFNVELELYEIDETENVTREIEMLYFATVAEAEAWTASNTDVIFVAETSSFYAYNASAKLEGSPATANDVYERDGVRILYANGNSTATVAGRWVRTSEPHEIGEPVPWYSDTVPVRYLAMDGTAFSATLYPKLNTAFGGTTMPDMRGVMPVGTGASTQGSVTRTGPTIRAFQACQLQGHRHAALTPTTRFIDTTGGAGLAGGSDVQILIASTTGNPVTDTVNGTPREGTYTRNAGVGFKYIVRAF